MTDSNLMKFYPPKVISSAKQIYSVVRGIWQSRGCCTKPHKKEPFDTEKGIERFCAFWYNLIA